MLTRSVFIPDNRNLTRMKYSPSQRCCKCLPILLNCVRFKAIAFCVTLPCGRVLFSFLNNPKLTKMKPNFSGLVGVKLRLLLRDFTSYFCPFCRFASILRHLLFVLARSVFIPDNRKLTRMKSNLAGIVGIK